MYVTSFRSLWAILDIQQWPIAAGHEFIVTTETKYAELSDDQIMFVDYVRLFSYRRCSLLTRTTGQLAQGYCSRQADLRR